MLIKIRFQLTVLLFLLVGIGTVNAQFVRGYVLDAQTGEPLIRANIYIPATEKGTSTNTDGFFTVQSTNENPLIRITYIGYQDTTLNLTVGTVHNIRLMPQSAELGEVVVEAQTWKNADATLSGVVAMPIKKLMELPTPGGEKDLLRALQWTPGVQQTNELSSGMHVRGGANDQNLILMDGVPLYSPWHLFGFFSTFNTDALKDVVFIRGVSPASKGDRLSSVIETTIADGRQDRMGGKISLGLLSNRIQLEGPIGSKVTFLVSGRRTYFNALQSLAAKLPDMDGGFFVGESSYGFTDLYGKVVYRPNDVSRLTFSAFHGNDILDISLDSTNSYFETFNPTKTQPEETTANVGLEYGWRNSAGSVQYETPFGDAFFLNTQVYLARYGYTTSLLMHADRTYEGFSDGIARPSDGDVTYDIVVNDIALKSNIDYAGIEDHHIGMGFEATLRTFTDTGVATSDPYWADIVRPGKNSFERIVNPIQVTAYITDNWQFADQFNLQAGLRAGWYSATGNPWLAPRMVLRYQPTAKLYFTAGVGKTVQTIQIVADELVTIPNVRWTPAGKDIDGASAWQYAVDGHYEISEHFKVGGSVYYKSLTGIYTLAGRLNESENDPSDVLAFLRPSSRLPIRGNGRAKGIEIWAEKRTGKLTGAINYTIANAERQFAGIINNQWHLQPYDRLHTLNMMLNQKLWKGWAIQAGFTYRSGQPFTIPEDGFIVDQDPLLPTGGASYATGNLYQRRATNQHRLDVSLTGNMGHIFGNQLKFSIDVYNVYAHQSPLFTNWGRAQAGSQFNAIEVTETNGLPLIPTVSLSYEF